MIKVFLKRFSVKDKIQNGSTRLSAKVSNRELGNFLFIFLSKMYKYIHKNICWQNIKWCGR